MQERAQHVKILSEGDKRPFCRELTHFKYPLTHTYLKYSLPHTHPQSLTHCLHAGVSTTHQNTSQGDKQPPGRAHTHQILSLTHTYLSYSLPHTHPQSHTPCLHAGASTTNEDTSKGEKRPLCGAHAHQDSSPACAHTAKAAFWVAGHIHICDMTHVYDDSFTFAHIKTQVLPVLTQQKQLFESQVTFTYVTWLMYMTTPSYSAISRRTFSHSKSGNSSRRPQKRGFQSQVPFICVTWLLYDDSFSGTRNLFYSCILQYKVLPQQNVRGVTLHIWVRHVICMNESCHTYECEIVLWHIWMNRVTHMSASCEIVSWHIWVSHVTHMSASCHTYEWVTLHIWVRHITHMNESCHTYEFDIVSWHIWVSHVTHMSESCHLYN